MHWLDVRSLNVISVIVKMSEFQSNKRKTIQMNPNCSFDFLQLKSSVELAGLKLPNFSLKTQSDHFMLKMMRMILLLVIMMIIIRGTCQLVSSPTCVPGLV